jgi:SAM-dependent methyltransferase
MSVVSINKDGSLTNPVSVLDAVLGKENPLPAEVTSIVSSFLSKDEMTLAHDKRHFRLLNPMPRFTDLTDPKVLKECFPESSQKEFHLLCSAEIAKSVYESGRNIANTSYGQAFPINPELLAYAMKLAKGETVVEIAGASGENAILLAFAGANRVYMNDICPEEMRTFRGLKSSLPKDVAGKLEAVEASCFDLLKIKPELEGKVGLIFCRNLIHFFNAKEQEEFFQNIKKMLKPGGKAILTVNAAYSFPAYKKTIEKNPLVTSFKTTQTTVTDFDRGSTPVAIIQRDMEKCPEDAVSTNYEALYIYERNMQTGFEWRANKEALAKVDEALRPKIKKACADSKELLESILDGRVRVLTNHIRLYTKENLTALCEKHGLEVDFPFVTELKGHLIPECEGDLFTEGNKVGVVVTKL